jgi:hypothetical protein
MCNRSAFSAMIHILWNFESYPSTDKPLSRFRFSDWVNLVMDSTLRFRSQQYKCILEWAASATKIDRMCGVVPYIDNRNHLPGSNDLWGCSDPILFIFIRLTNHIRDAIPMVSIPMHEYSCVELEFVDINDILRRQKQCPHQTWPRNPSLAAV